MNRDQILEQALKHELRGAGAKTAEPARRSFSEGGCLDAETLAAWQDDSLDAAQISAIESHVSACAHCQAMVAAFARGTLGTVGTPGTLETTDTFRWWRWWLAPLAAGATAAVLWTIVPEQQQIATQPAEKKAAAVDSLERQAEVVPKQLSPASPAAADADLRARANSRGFDENKLKRDAREDRQQLKDQAALKEEVAVDQTAGQRAAAVATVAPPPPAAPMAPPAASPQARSENFSQPAELQKRAAEPAVPPIAVAPDGSVRWRINNQFVVRYDNNSAIGTALYRLKDEETITAGAAPNGSTLWLVGKSGVVLVSLDGMSFNRVDLPERVDIVRIVTAGSQSLTVMTSDGRQFRTNDFGGTWRQIQA